MIGIFFEDINYGADGGLYAEMLENRSFEFLDARGDKDAYHQIFDGLYGWSAYPKEQAELQIQKINRHKNEYWLKTTPVPYNNAHLLHMYNLNYSLPWHDNSPRQLHKLVYEQLVRLN